MYCKLLTNKHLALYIPKTKALRIENLILHKQMDTKNEVWKAMADPQRREILTLLEASALTATEIAEKSKGSFANTSQHLKILLNAQLIEIQQVKKYRVYSLNGTLATEMLQWLSKLCITKIQTKIMLDHKLDSLQNQ